MDSRRTVLHVLLAHARHMRAPVDDALALADELVEEHRAVVVDNADTRETGFRAVADADHLAVNRDILARTASPI